MLNNSLGNKKYCTRFSNPEERARKISLKLKGRKKSKEEIERNRRSILSGFVNGRMVHNKGKTKDNYEPLRRVAEKASKRCKGVSRGSFSLEWRRNLSIHTKKQMSNPAARELLSRLMIERIKDGKVKGYGRSGSFYSHKNQKNIHYRSTWELLAMQIFEQMVTVLKYEYEVLSISYMKEDGRIHRTVPDFLIYYNDGRRQIIEVKAEWNLENKATQLKIGATKDYCDKNNLLFSVWSSKELGIK